MQKKESKIIDPTFFYKSIGENKILIISGTTLLVLFLIGPIFKMVAKGIDGFKDMQAAIKR